MPNASPERRIHLAVLGYLRLRLPDAAIHHSANEIGLAGKAVARQIAKAKHMGMMVGFPDLMVLWRGQALFFEVKAPGNYPTEAQKAAHELLTANGAQCTSSALSERWRRSWGAYRAKHKMLRPKSRWSDFPQTAPR